VRFRAAEPIRHVTNGQNSLLVVLQQDLPSLDKKRPKSPNPQLTPRKSHQENYGMGYGTLGALSTDPCGRGPGFSGLRGLSSAQTTGLWGRSHGTLGALSSLSCMSGRRIQ
jgi:hypothetical protein